MDQTYSELSWLPRTPADFGDRLNRLRTQPDTAGMELRRLASHALTNPQLTKVSKFLSSANAAGQSLKPLTPFRLGVLSNSTTDFLATAITGTSPRFGFSIECVVGDYDQALQESRDPESRLNRSKPDGVLIAFDWRALRLQSSIGSAGAEQEAIDRATAYLQSIRQEVRRHTGAVCIVQTVAAPPERLFGSLDRTAAGSLPRVVHRVNEAIAASIESSGDVLLDVAGLAECVGLANWHSPSQWNLAKLPFATEFLPLYADHVCRTISAMRGGSRRCLVLDLDNTVWGGVIGDDGLKGIRLAQGDAVGEAYLDFQQYVLDLRQRGIVLAVSSKNDDLVARSVFREHPEMLLREKHIAVFQANWNDKASNIAAIASTLSLGLQSLVFVDDNPFERELVRNALPEVAVVELPDDPALYARTLSAAGYFELTKLSAEDLGRAEFYDGNARRTALEQSVGNVEEYLQSLDMEIVFQPFDQVGQSRIAQLINKSNQFNLTTRRYSEVDVAALAEDPSCFTLQVRLIDRFGDNGMISVLICRNVGEAEWVIDTWLMSCRVLGRRVEEMLLHEVRDHALAQGARALVGEFIPTSRNGMVAEHYHRLGFELVEREADGTTRWRLPLSKPLGDRPSMRVRRAGEVLSTSVAG